MKEKIPVHVLPCTNKALGFWYWSAVVAMFLMPVVMIVSIFGMESDKMVDDDKVVTMFSIFASIPFIVLFGIFAKSFRALRHNISTYINILNTVLAISIFIDLINLGISSSEIDFISTIVVSVCNTILCLLIGFAINKYYAGDVGKTGKKIMYLPLVIILIIAILIMFGAILEDTHSRLLSIKAFVYGGIFLFYVPYYVYKEIFRPIYNALKAGLWEASYDQNTKDIYNNKDIAVSYRNGELYFIVQPQYNQQSYSPPSENTYIQTATPYNSNANYINPGNSNSNRPNNKILKYVLIGLGSVIVIGAIGYAIFASRSVISDKETEEMLEGSWQNISYQSNDDGSQLIMTTDVTYESDHSFDVVMTVDMKLDESAMHLLTISYSGKWKASKDKLLEDVNKDMINYIPSPDIDESEFAKIKDEFEKELEEDTKYIFEIRSISKDSFTIYDEEGESFEFFRTNGSVEKSDNISLPTWLPQDVLPIFRMDGKLTKLTSDEVYDWLITHTDYDNYAENNYYEGKFDDYSISAEMEIGIEGSVSGRYAYESTLRKNGNGAGSWFTFRGAVMVPTNDGDETYLLLQTHHPDDNRVFEYALLRFVGEGNWEGKIFNVKYLSDPSNVKMHTIRLNILAEYDSWMDDAGDVEADTAVVSNSSHSYETVETQVYDTAK